MIPRLGRSPGAGNGYPLQCPGLEDSMYSIVQGVAKSQTRLSDCTFTALYQKVGIGEKGDIGQRIETSSCKTSKFWGSNV